MSSTATRLPYAVVEAAACRLFDLIGDACESIMLAGSMRRRAESVGDGEAVAVPKLVTYEQRDLFGEIVTTTTVDLLWARLDTLADDGLIVKRPRRDGKLVWGPLAKAFAFDGVPFDLYTPEKERAGWIVLVRTGPAAFARQLVVEVGHRTKDGRPGLMPPTVRAVDGWLVDRVSGRRLETPPRDAFAALKLAYLEPWERR